MLTSFYPSHGGHAAFEKRPKFLAGNGIYMGLAQPVNVPFYPQIEAETAFACPIEYF
jgi:hypothetical protein